MKNILIVGLGSIGRRHTDNFSKYFDEIDIVDINPDRIEQARSEYNINNSFNNYSDALDNNSYDAVAITTPPHLHLPIAKLAAEKGANLFIEKPLGMSVDGWAEVADICKNSSLVSYVAYCVRHVPYTKKLKELIDGGKIGRVIHASIRWGSYLPDWHPWEDYRSFYMAKKEQGGGALLDESHGIDLVRYILGEVKEVFAIVDTISDLEISSDDTAFLTLRLQNNSLVQIDFDLNSRFPRVTFEIVGTEGTVIWDDVKHQLKIYNAENKSWSNKKYSKNEAMSLYPKQAAHFYNCLYNDEQPLIDIDDAIRTQGIIDAAFKSNKTDRLISIS